MLISSLRPAARLQDLTEVEVADLFRTSVKVEQVLEKHHNSTSTTVCVQDGKNAGQTVPVCVISLIGLNYNSLL